MKAVLLEAYMQSAQFKVPVWFKREVTYPLPPFSTVIGMIHHICGWKEYHEINTSISGKGFLNTDIQSRWKGGHHVKTESEEFKKRFPVRVKDNTGFVGWVNSPSIVDWISDLRLRIHIAPESEEDLCEISSNLLNPREYPSLGRHEDILRIDNVKIVEIDSEESEAELDLDIYCDNVELGGTVYSLHKKYEIVNNRRIFQNVKAIVLPSGTIVKCLKDNFGNPVFLC